MVTTEDFPTWVEINLSAVEQNTRFFMELTGVPVMAVIKADAYGHGAIEIGRTALDAGATWLAVARYCEASVLRMAGITAPILVLGMITPGEVDEAIANSVTVTLHSFEVADLFSQRASAIGKPVNAHLKIDTGMGRLGVLPDQVVKLAQYVEKIGGIHLDGVYSHFAMSHNFNHPFTSYQIGVFTNAVESLREVNVKPRWVHIADTASAMVNSDSYFNMVRIGSGILGIWPIEDSPCPYDLRPAFSWKARLASCKTLPKGWSIGYGQTYILPEDQIIGVIPVGYVDGLRRTTGNEVIIDNQRVPVIGRICVDQAMILLPKQYPIGTEVTIIGSQEIETITLDECAARWKTVAVDVSSSINFRVPRYVIRG
jgi:alanine racemase